MIDFSASGARRLPYGQSLTLAGWRNGKRNYVKSRQFVGSSPTPATTISKWRNRMAAFKGTVQGRAKPVSRQGDGLRGVRTSNECHYAGIDVHGKVGQEGNWEFKIWATGGFMGRIEPELIGTFRHDVRGNRTFEPGSIPAPARYQVVENIIDENGIEHGTRWPDEYTVGSLDEAAHYFVAAVVAGSYHAAMNENDPATVKARLELRDENDETVAERTVTATYQP